MIGIIQVQEVYITIDSAKLSSKTVYIIILIIKNYKCSQLEWGGLQNRPTASLPKGKTPTTNECPRYDTKQHLMVRFQSRSLGESEGH